MDPKCSNNNKSRKAASLPLFLILKLRITQAVGTIVDIEIFTSFLNY